jgi:hypothetical protein
MKWLDRMIWVGLVSSFIGLVQFALPECVDGGPTVEQIFKWSLCLVVYTMCFLAVKLR